MTKKVSKEKLAEFHQALGHFCQKISNVETSLFAAVQVMSGVDAHVLANLVTSWRLAASIDIIKRLLELFDYPKDAVVEIKEALAHLADIESLRNGILHGTIVRPSPDILDYFGKESGYDFGTELIGTNVHTAKSRQAARAYPVSKEILDNAVSDLQRVNATLILFQLQLLEKADPERKQPDLETLRKYREKRQTPWLYKPYQISSKRLQSHASAQPEEPRPRSSTQSGPKAG